MTWRGSSTPKDRFFACLTYLVPLLEVFPLGGVIFAVLPVARLLFLPLLPLLPIYFLSIGGFQLIALAIFFGIFIGVVQNRKFGHFLRFNAMQALLLAIFVFLSGAVLQLVGVPISAVEANPSIPVAAVVVFGIFDRLICPD